MTLSAVFTDLIEISIRLDQIHLDPNNPRFTAEDWNYVPEAQIGNAETQEHTMNRMIQEFKVEKLKMNMEVNGYLPIDRVIVREFDGDKYVVLEGNRRISAAKRLKQLIERGAEYPDHVVNSLVEIPCLQYTGHERDASAIFQGLRHISGVLPWSAYNKAKLLVEQMEEEDLSFGGVGQIFGLTSHGAGQWARGYFAFKQAREESDYHQEVDERAFPYFQEVFSRSSIPVREWMDWSFEKNRFESEPNFIEFLGWLYPREEPEDERSEEDVPGDWEKRALKRSGDIRDVAYLITKAPREFTSFRHDLNLEKAYALAQARQAEEDIARETDPLDALLKATEECARKLENAPMVRILGDEELRDKLTAHIRKLNGAIKSVEDLL